MKRLLLTGTNTIHTYNYLDLVKDHFSEVMLIVQKGGRVDVPGVKVVTVDFSLRNPLVSGRTVDQLKKLINEFKPSVIHAHQAGSSAYQTLKAAKGTGIPTIVTAWGSDILLVPKMGWLYKKMVKYILKHASSFTSDSLYMAAEMEKLLPEKNLDILIANFGITTGHKWVTKENLIYSNRLHKKLYRIDKIIHAFAKFKRLHEGEKWKLIIAASGDETDNLKSLIMRLGIEDSVEMPGWVNAQVNADYYSRAKIFVSIPESDATSISLLEALAAGCIPVVSNLPANMEWVIDDINGVIVTNIKEEFMGRALQLEQEKAIAFNKQIIDKKGTKEVNREKFIGLYERLIRMS